MRQLPPLAPDFARSAAVRLAFEAPCAAPPGAVYAVLTDAASWPSWFPGVRRARTVDAERREVHLSGGSRFVERIVVASPGECFAYQAEITDVPGVRALREEWCLEAAEGGSLLRYAITADGTSAFRAALRAMRPGLAWTFRRAARNLPSAAAARGAGTSVADEPG